MSKVQSATVRLVMKKCKVNSIGEHPIYLSVCYNGRKELSTGVFILERYWNPLKEEVRKGCANAPVLNKMINDIKQRVIRKKNEFEYAGKKYTPAMLLEEDIVQDLSANDNIYKNIFKRYLDETGSSVSTIRLYDYTFNVLKKYFGRDNFLINDITLANIKKLINSLDLGDNSIRGICGRIAAVWNFGIRKGIVDSSDYPFRDFIYSQKFKKENRTYYIDEVNLRKIKDYFIDCCLDISGELFGYKSGIEDRLMKRSSKEFALMFFLICYRLNGSSPIDVALLRAENCSRVYIDGEDFWRIEFKRRKTGRGVVCLLKRDILTMVCFEHYLGRSRGGYIYPVLKDGIEGKQITNAMGKFCSEAVRWLREVSKEINEQTIKDNVEKGLEEPLIDVEEICLYSARHSFANSYLSKPNASIAAMASLMARSPNTIATYIHQLKGDRDVADAVKDLPI
jgi:hypothetical protein